MSTHYICGTDFEQELEGCLDVFDTVEELKEKKPCHVECGIVEMELDAAGEVKAHVWIQKPTRNC